MMDRTKLHLQPDSQVGFITGICIPCYGLLYQLIPETKPLLDGCQSNLERWKKLAKENESLADINCHGNEQDENHPQKVVDQKTTLTRAKSLPSSSLQNDPGE